VRLCQDFVRHVVDGAVHDLVDEADISISPEATRKTNSGPRHFRIDDGLAAVACHRRSSRQNILCAEYF
jgi:hypothetical protein